MKNSIFIFTLAFILSGSANAKTYRPNFGTNIYQSKTGYRVLLLTTAPDESIPVSVMNALYDVGQIKPVKNKDGSTSYYSKKFETKQECELAMATYSKLGFSDMAVVKVRREK